MTNQLTDRIPPATRSVIRRVEDLLPQIEDGLVRGYSHAVMHAELATFGINISFAYYERVLRLLRQERRLAEQPCRGTSNPAQVPGEDDKQAAIVTRPAETKVDDLTGAIPGQTSGSIDKVTVARSSPAPFRWKGSDLLNKDWSEF